MAGGLQVNAPIRVQSGSFINNDDYFRRYFTLAAEKAKSRAGSVLIVLDCDDDDKCPGVLGPELLRRSKGVRDDVPVLVALAWREYETWLVTAARSLAGFQGLPADLQPPPAPDAIRGAKEWFGDRMPHRYDPVTHQVAFTKRFDLALARTNRSFDRLCRKLEAMLRVPAA